MQSVVHDHGVFALKHDAGEGDRDNGRNDNIEHQIQQEFPRNSAPPNNEIVCLSQNVSM